MQRCRRRGCQHPKPIFMTYLRVFLGLTCLVLVCGCKKHNGNSSTDNTTAETTALDGAWNWVYAVKLGAVPGSPGDSITPASTGDQLMLSFRLEGNYQLIHGDTTVMNTGYWYITTQPLLGDTLFLVLLRGGGMDSAVNHGINHDTLWIAPRIPDSTSYTWYYKKIPPPAADPL